MKQLSLFPDESRAQQEKIYAYPFEQTEKELLTLSEPLGEEGFLVQRTFEKDGHFTFSGKSRIRDERDVAFIFRQLETASVENSFFVLVKDNIPTVIHVGMGSFAHTQINLTPAIVADSKIHADAIYFVHNHPSGNLRPSYEDLLIYEKYHDYFGRRLQPGIIIDTFSGTYSCFGGIMDGEYRQQEASVKEDIPMQVYSFSKQIYAKNYTPENEKYCNGADSVAKYLTGIRMGGRDKLSYLILAQDGAVRGNIHTHYTTIDDSNVHELGKKIAHDVAVFGGTGYVVYGTAKIHPEPLQRLQRYTNETGFQMFDYLQLLRRSGVEQAQNQDKVYSYISAADNNFIETSRRIITTKPSTPVLMYDYESEVLEAVTRKIDSELRTDRRFFKTMSRATKDTAPTLLQELFLSDLDDIEPNPYTQDIIGYLHPETQEFTPPIGITDPIAHNRLQNNGKLFRQAAERYGLYENLRPEELSELPNLIKDHYVCRMVLEDNEAFAVEITQSGKLKDMIDNARKIWDKRDQKKAAKQDRKKSTGPKL